MSPSYRAELEDVASEFALDVDVLEAQMIVESSGHTDAFRFEPGIWDQIVAGKLTPKFAWQTMVPRRVAGSYGLLQILYVTAADIGFTGEPETLFIPHVGLTWGAHYFRTLMTRYAEDRNRALAAYNGGPGAVIREPYRTQAYADKVFAQVRKGPTT